MKGPQTIILLQILIDKFKHAKPNEIFRKMPPVNYKHKYQASVCTFWQVNKQQLSLTSNKTQEKVLSVFNKMHIHGRFKSAEK